MGLGLRLGLYDSYWWDKSSCTEYDDDWVKNLKNIRAHKTIFDMSYSMITLWPLIGRVSLYDISRNDNGCTYMWDLIRSYLKIPSIICLSFIIYNSSSDCSHNSIMLPNSSVVFVLSYVQLLYPSLPFSFTINFDSIFVPRLVSYNFNTQFAST